MKKIPVRLGSRSYNILIGSNAMKAAGQAVRNAGIGEDGVIITNNAVLSLCGKSLERSLKKNGATSRFITVPDSEKAKSNSIATRTIKKISLYDKNRKLFIIALGGGVVGDLAGFVASIYKRGVPYIQIPTTLLAQVDSAIGGKVAIDLSVAKNLVGSFYQPKLVLSDTAVLRSLSKRQVRNGMAEIIKYGVIKDKKLFEYLERNYKRVLALRPDALEFVISRSAAIKAGVVEKDELDKKGVRVILNYGHTIGHAIEAASGYSNRYNHGEAVALGMIAAGRISKIMGMISVADLARIEKLIARSGLPVRIRGIKFNDIYRAHLYDKKFINKRNRFVLPVTIGRVRVAEGIPDIVIKNVLKGLFEK